MLGEFLNAVSAVVVLLMLMAVGYFMGTKGWMKAEEKKFLSKYIINIDPRWVSPGHPLSYYVRGFFLFQPFPSGPVAGRFPLGRRRRRRLFYGDQGLDESGGEKVPEQVHH